MNQEYSALFSYSGLLIIALIMNQPFAACFTIFCGLLTMAMYQYGGDTLRKVLRKWLG